MNEIDLNVQFVEALKIMNADSPFVFITGRAGTGKSTLLRYFRKQTQKRCVILAPTGVAALNVDGETIHSFFGFAPGVDIREAKRKAGFADADLYRAIDIMVIDEISMVRADVLDCMDVFLRRVRKNHEPFGGVCVIAIGDLFQLPPVVSHPERDAYLSRYASPFFFSADVIEELRRNGCFECIELVTVYRQKDESYVHLLNGLRNASLTHAELQCLNKQVRENVEDCDVTSVYLTMTNKEADTINHARLMKLPSKGRVYTGVAKGTFTQKDLPTEGELTLRPGARVMFIKNDPQGRFVNGNMGVVDRVESTFVMVRPDGAKDVYKIEPVVWNMYRSVYDRESHTLSQEKTGSFTQIPLRLAWATTVHKSQGKTFDRIVVDVGRGVFASGQLYVALSRCTRLEGVVLKRPITHHHLRLDEQVQTFFDTVVHGARVQKMDF